MAHNAKTLMDQLQPSLGFNCLVMIMFFFLLPHRMNHKVQLGRACLASERSNAMRRAVGEKIPCRKTNTT